MQEENNLKRKLCSYLSGAGQVIFLVRLERPVRSAVVRGAHDDRVLVQVAVTHHLHVDRSSLLSHVILRFLELDHAPSEFELLGLNFFFCFLKRSSCKKRNISLFNSVVEIQKNM